MSQHSLIIWGVLMGRRGRKRRLDVESEYWRLVLSGVGTVETLLAIDDVLVGPRVERCSGRRLGMIMVRSFPLSRP